MARTKTITPLTSEQLAEIEQKRARGQSTEEEDVAYYVTLGIDETAARFQVGAERGKVKGDVGGGYQY